MMDRDLRVLNAIKRVFPKCKASPLLVPYASGKSMIKQYYYFNGN